MLQSDPRGFNGPPNADSGSEQGRVTLLTRYVAGSTVQSIARVGDHPKFFDGGTMSSTASLITLLASVAFGLVVIAVIMRIGEGTSS